MLKTPKFPDGLEEVFIGKIWGEGCRARDFFCLVGGEVTGPPLNVSLLLISISFSMLLSYLPLPHPMLSFTKRSRETEKDPVGLPGTNIFVYPPLLVCRK